MTNDKAINCNLNLLEFMKIENMLHPNCVFADDNFEALEMANSALKAQSADGDCITDEQAIEHLQSTGWMQNHDREMYESGLRKQLADDSGSYDALIPSKDTISRKAAIEAVEHITSSMSVCVNTDECHGMKRMQRQAVIELANLPSAQPEIVRCKDCKWKQGAECVRFADVRPFPDDFCSRAERKTEDDLISRQAAIDAVCSVCGVDCDKSEFVYGGKQEDQVILCPEHYVLTQLPSAQPEWKKGKWIYHPAWETDGECGYECDQCGMGSDVNYDFCPRCGSAMRG